MPIDPSIADLTWLTQPGDAGTNLARGAAVGAHIAQQRMHNASLAQRAMEFEQQQTLAKRELVARLQLLPLEEKLKEQEAQMNQAKINSFLDDRQIEANAGLAFAALQNRVSPLMEAGEIEKAQNLILAEKNGWLFADPKKRLHTLYEMTTKAQDAKLALIQAKGAARANEFTPGFGVATNPLTGEPEAYWRQSPNNAPLLKPDKVETPSTAEKNFKQLDSLQQALAAATASGDPAAITEAKRRLDTFSALATPPAETMTFDSKTGAVTISKGKQLGEVTPTNATRLQESLQSAVANIDIANRLEPLISTETVGARAFAESWIKDRVLAQAFPELASNNRAKAEAFAAQLRATAIQQLKSDGNISEKERGQILQAVPEINSPIDSPARAKQLIDASRRMAAIRAVVAATKLKAPVPGAAAKVLSTTELKRLVDTGVITPEQALAAFDAK